MTDTSTNNNTDRYAVFGNPISHSKSPRIHSRFAELTAEQLTYTAELVPEGEFASHARNFFANGGKGLNITVPFKLDALAFADELTPRAAMAGAVNTLWADEHGTVTGDNTDGVGMLTDITINLDWQVSNQRVLVLGAGGAVRGVLGPLLDQQPQQLVIANRTVSKAETLAQFFADQYPSLSIASSSFSDLPEQPFGLIVNGTSASLGGDLPPLHPTLVDAQTCCYDMMYSPDLTVFLQWAKDQGSTQLSDGLGMLVEQAAESFFQWRGQRPPTNIVLDEIRRNS